tara:strand:+ start:25 stop:396 length:372 start_codon:yes stop_codon:yes gene_type:complete
MSAVKHISFIFELKITDPEKCLDFMKNQAVPYTSDLDEPKTKRFEWYVSPDKKNATLIEFFDDSDGAKLRIDNLLSSHLLEIFQSLFEIESFIVLGDVKDDLKEILDGFGADYRDYAAGFLRA